MDFLDIVNRMAMPTGMLEKLVWDYFLENLFKSKSSIKISIVGPTLCGKTTLFDIIREENNVKKEAGRGTPASGRELKSKTVRIGEKELVIKETRDYDGNLSSTTNYKKLFQGADVILFLFDIEQFIRNAVNSDSISYQNQVASMLKIFCVDGAKHVKKQRAFIIGTHKDKLNNYNLSPRAFKETLFYPFLTNENLEEVRFFPFEALNLLSIKTTRNFLEANIYRYAK